ncbi:MAG TPA: HD-GYP domain-containing protein [Chloroflexota bacterium]|nr:HD-GYP domain-containing protein [Chloroflexota bacterium]
MMISLILAAAPPILLAPAAASAFSALAVLTYQAARRAGGHIPMAREMPVTMMAGVGPALTAHSRRVAEFSEAIARALDCRGEDADLIVAAARLHDIGKSRVPAAVLNKPGPLTQAEWEVMRTHAEIGANALQESPAFAKLAAIVRHHHERWDGHGYPHQLRATTIPLGARIIAVADSFDAMTSDRPYHRKMHAEEAAKVLRQGRGTQWDAVIVDTFLKSLPH